MKLLVRTAVIVIAVAASFVAAADVLITEKVDSWERACDEGKAEGCLHAGRAYSEGYRVKRDRERGADLWRRACELESGKGCYLYGVCLHKISKKPEDAFSLYERSCRLDYAEGCYRVGDMLRTGEAGAVDLVRARRAWGKACELGSGIGCHDLSVSCVIGEGGEADSEQACSSSKRGCELGSEKACEFVPVACGMRFHFAIMAVVPFFLLSGVCAFILMRGEPTRKKLLLWFTGFSALSVLTVAGYSLDLFHVGYLAALKAGGLAILGCLMMWLVSRKMKKGRGR